MAEYRFGVTGKRRTALVKAVSGILNAEYRYMNPPTFAFEVGGYTITKDGTVIGEENLNLIAALQERGFDLEEPEVNVESEIPSEPLETAIEAAETELPNETEAEDESTGFDYITIEYPLEGIDDTVLSNLRKLISAKAPLIKKALEIDDLSIFLTPTTIKFPWFSGELDAETLQAYSQFITALCETAKHKKRVTATAPASFENERFSMRVWLISLGMIGGAYSLARKLFSRNLIGDSGWRYGKPERVLQNTHTPITINDMAYAK